MPAARNIYLSLTSANPVQTNSPANVPTSSSSTLTSRTENTLFLPLAPAIDTRTNSTTTNSTTTASEVARATLPSHQSNMEYEGRQLSSNKYEYRADLAAPYNQYDSDDFRTGSYNALLLFPPKPHGWLGKEPSRGEPDVDGSQDKSQCVGKLEDGNGGYREDSEPMRMGERGTTEEKGSEELGTKGDGSTRQGNGSKGEGLELDFTHDGEAGHGGPSTPDWVYGGSNEENIRSSECGESCSRWGDCAENPNAGLQW